MKKIILVIALAFVLLLGGCDLLGPDQTITEEPSPTTTITTEDGAKTETTTQNTTQSGTTTQNTTQPETTTTTQSPSTTESTTIINDEIYLRLNGGQDTVEINTDWTDAGAVFVLNDMEYDMTTTDTVDPSSLGLYTITYTYEYEEETYTINRYVIVVDQTAPEIELNLGVDTVGVGGEWTDTGVTITDNSGESLTAEVTGTVDTNTLGTYEIIYTATDSSGNSSSITRYVTVIETNPDDPINSNPDFPDDDLVDFNDLEAIPRYPESILYNALDGDTEQVRAYVVKEDTRVVYDYYKDYFYGSDIWEIEETNFTNMGDVGYFTLYSEDESANIVIEPNKAYDNAADIFIYTTKTEDNPVSDGDIPGEDKINLNDIAYVPRYPGSILIDGADSEDVIIRVYVTGDNPKDIYDMYLEHYNEEPAWTIIDHDLDVEMGEGYLSLVIMDDMTSLIIDFYPSEEYTDAWEISIQYTEG